MGSEEAADTDEKQLARREAIAEGKVTLEQFDKDFDAAPKSFYVNLEAAFDGTLESLALLGEACDAKFGDVSPGFGTLRATLEEVRQTVHSLLQRKREKEPDAPVDAPAAEIEEVEEAPVEAEAPAAVTLARAAPARRGGAPLRRTGGSRRRGGPGGGSGEISASGRRRTVRRLTCCCADCAGANCARQAKPSTRRCWLRRRRRSGKS